MSNDLILSIEDAMVLIGGKPFFENLTFHIHRGRKIALVGRNGAGKTTLMNLITGDREVDDGRRWILAGTKIGYMQQHIDPLPGQTVAEFVFSGMDAQTEEWSKLYKTEMIIEPLGLKTADRLDQLSGGMLRRVALARALVEEPDILLLDEPTNHMDLETIQWLENYLSFYPGALLCVSHDRAFLAEISDRVFWLDRGQLKISPHGFAQFEEWSQDLLDQEARQLHNREKKLEMELEWANRGVKARVKRNVRRVALARAEKDRLEADKMAYRRVVSKIALPPLKAEESSLNVAEFINVNKSFQHPQTGEEKIIMDRFNMRIRRRDRIGIMGRNGSGKTTFLKLLIGEEQADSGKVKMAKNLEFSYFDQKRSSLEDSQTLQENLCPPGSDHLDVRGKSRHVCGYLKDFLFQPEDAWRAVRTLSGGQKNRLMLAKVLANPGSFLILDEPTNDLDMDTLDMLENIIAGYDGTLFIVSHDRDFLDQTVNKLLVFEGDGKIEGIIGGYSDYIAFKKERDAEKTPAPIQENSKPALVKTKDADTPPKKKSGGKMSYKLEYELKNLPSKIEALEKECADLAEKMKDPDFYNQNQEEFMKASRRYAAAKEELDEAELRWLELDEMRIAAEKET